MTVIYIDFDEADKISKELTALNDEITSLTNIISNINSNINSMPSDFSTSAKSTVDSLNTNIKLVKESITKAQEVFDAQIKNYRDMEDDVTIPDVPDLEDDFTPKGLVDYYGYPSGTSEMQKISKDELAYYLTKNFKSDDGNVYVFNYNGKECKYRLSNGRIYINGENAKCDFYKSAKTSLGNIRNVTTMIGGSGEIRSGEYGKLNKDTKIYDGSLVLDIYDYAQNDGNTSKSNDIIAAGTIVGDHLANPTNPSKPYNTIIGFSMGGQSASRTVANYKGLYQSYISVNSSSCWSGDINQDLILKVPDGYKSFNDKNLEILLVRSVGDQDGLKTTQYKQIDRMIENGVPASSINYLTNDSNILEKLKGTGINAIKLNNDKIIGHAGGHELISGLLGYTTSK